MDLAVGQVVEAVFKLIVSYGIASLLINFHSLSVSTDIYLILFSYKECLDGQIIFPLLRDKLE